MVWNTYVLRLHDKHSLRMHCIERRPRRHDFHCCDGESREKNDGRQSSLPSKTVRKGDSERESIKANEGSHARYNKLRRRFLEDPQSRERRLVSD